MDDGLGREFPPLKSLDDPALSNNLPAQLGSFVGRRSEVAQVREMLQSTRLVTLTGAGGGAPARGLARRLGSVGGGPRPQKAHGSMGRDRPAASAPASRSRGAAQPARSGSVSQSRYFCSGLQSAKNAGT